MKTLLKSATALAAVLALTSFASAAPPTQQNESFVNQVGTSDSANVQQADYAGSNGKNRNWTFQGDSVHEHNNVANTTQTVYAGAHGKNSAGTFQDGSNNAEVTTQTIGINAQGDNHSWTSQHGDSNKTNHFNVQGTRQTIANGAYGYNNSLVSQRGDGNWASTTQTITNPLSSGPTYNTSFIVQGSKFFGSSDNNTAIVNQTTTGNYYPGSNFQFTWQGGSGSNSAVTTQVSSNYVSNSSVTAQYGSHNSAIVNQH